jgi:hypothetical protein
MAFDYKMAGLWLSQMSREGFPSLFGSHLDDRLLADYERHLPQVK